MAQPCHQNFPGEGIDHQAQPAEPQPRDQPPPTTGGNRQLTQTFGMARQSPSHKTQGEQSDPEFQATGERRGQAGLELLQHVQSSSGRNGRVDERSV